MPDANTPIFKGFSQGKHETIAIPTQFFRDVLPHVSDPAQLHVMLFCFRALYQQAHDQSRRVRYLQKTDFVNDDALMQAITRITPEADPADALDDALASLVELGFLLVITAGRDDQHQTLYFVNTPRGRQAVAQIEAGEWHSIGDHIDILPERPNIYKLYEENIGSLTPLIADALRDAEASYPHNWIEDALRLAVENNARNWRYISAILERWQTEGRSHAPHEGHRQRTARDDREYGSGEYADIIES